MLSVTDLLCVHFVNGAQLIWHIILEMLNGSTARTIAWNTVWLAAVAAECLPSRIAIWNTHAQA